MCVHRNSRQTVCTGIEVQWLMGKGMWEQSLPHHKWKKSIKISIPQAGGCDGCGVETFGPKILEELMCEIANLVVRVFNKSINSRVALCD